jgi:Holliday junction resolvase RusA-like endonuclease
MKLIIPGKLPGLNEYVKACRANRYAGAQMKQKAEDGIKVEIGRQLGDKKFESVRLAFHWFEQNKRRDFDNIAFAKKFLLDALQATGTLKNDGWNQIAGFSDTFSVDKKCPRIEVEIQEVVSP